LVAEFLSLCGGGFGVIITVTGEDDAGRGVDGDGSGAGEGGADGFLDESFLRADSRDQESQFVADNLSHMREVKRKNLLGIPGILVSGGHYEAGISHNAEFLCPLVDCSGHEFPVGLTIGESNVLSFAGGLVAGVAKSDDGAAGVFFAYKILHTVLAHIR